MPAQMRKVPTPMALYATQARLWGSTFVYARPAWARHNLNSGGNLAAKRSKR
jgi:hypothetical protein